MTPDTGSQKRTIVLVDDHPLVREWLANLINQQSDLQVCGEAGSAPEGLSVIQATQPHVAVVDISMEGGSGIELIKQVRATCKEVIVLVLSMHDELVYAERALRAGARGYVMKREATKKVLQAVRCVLEGKLYVSEQMALLMTQRFVEGRLATPDAGIALLSDRELEVFQLLGRGHRTKQIAEELHINFRTVQAFCARIKDKLKLANATELLREAVRWHEGQNMQ